MSVSDVLNVLLVGCGIFTVVLGTAHVVFPYLAQYRALIYAGSNHAVPLRPLQLGSVTYPLNADTVYRLIWLMNHHVSFVLVSIGVVDLFWSSWLLGEGRYLLFWIAAWWWLRAGLQLMLGRHPRDWFLLAFFFVLGVIHLGAGLA